MGRRVARGNEGSELKKTQDGIEATQGHVSQNRGVLVWGSPGGGKSVPRPVQWKSETDLR